MAKSGARFSQSGNEENEVERRAQVILYTKPGCHLCDEMKEEILRAGCSDLYTLDEVNIESDPNLLARYLYEIPVLLIDGVEVFKGNYLLDAGKFSSKLTACQSQAGSLLSHLFSWHSQPFKVSFRRKIGSGKLRCSQLL